MWSIHLHCTLRLVRCPWDRRGFTCSRGSRITTALAAVTFLRSVIAFGLPLFAPAMYSALGYGKGDTLLACVAIVGCPMYVATVTCYRSF